MPTHTPWGISDTEKQIAPGIMGYTTPSHGGYHLSAERLAEMPAGWKSVHGYSAGWYEEDCTWSLVVLAFPEAFDAFSLTYALPCAVCRVPSAGAATSSTSGPRRCRTGTSPASKWPRPSRPRRFERERFDEHRHRRRLSARPKQHRAGRPRAVPPYPRASVHRDRPRHPGRRVHRRRPRGHRRRVRQRPALGTDPTTRRHQSRRQDPSRGTTPMTATTEGRLYWPRRGAWRSPLAGTGRGPWPGPSGWPFGPGRPWPPWRPFQILARLPTGGLAGGPSTGARCGLARPARLPPDACALVGRTGAHFALVLAFGPVRTSAARLRESGVD